MVCLFPRGTLYPLISVIQNPAFGNSHIREMTDIVVAKSAEVRIMLFTSRKCINRGTQQLKDCLLEQVASSPQPGQAKVEITSWLSRATLDIIGLAGFNYSFDALKFGEDSNELGYAFTQLFNNAQIAGLIGILHAYFPLLRWIVRLPIFLFESPTLRNPIAFGPAKVEDGPAIQDALQGPANDAPHRPPARPPEAAGRPGGAGLRWGNGARERQE
jgi:hypothetical protein